MEKIRNIDMRIVINWLAPGVIPVSIDGANGVVVLRTEKMGESSWISASFMRQEKVNGLICMREVSGCVGRSYADAFYGLSKNIRDAAVIGLRAKQNENYSVK